MNVYQTRRTAALPKDVTDRVREQAPKVELNGFGLRTSAARPRRSRSRRTASRRSGTTSSAGRAAARAPRPLVPVRSNGDYYKIGFKSQRIYAQNMADPEPNRLFYALGYFTEPATLRGTIFLVHEPVDQVAEQRSA